MATRPKRPARAKRKLIPSTDDFVKVSSASVGKLQQFIVRVGTAILGGNLTGDARGLNAIDIATNREDKTQVVGGEYSVAIGALNTVTGGYGVRIGYAGAVLNESGVGIGNNANVQGENGVAIGLNSNAEGDDSVALGGADIRTLSAIGIGSTAKLINAEYAFNTGVGPIIKRAAGLAAQGNWPRHLAGAYAVYTSGILDLKTATFYTLALPDGAKMILLAMGLICTTFSAITVQPTIEFGVTFDDDKYVAPVLTTNLTAVGKCEHYAPGLPLELETDPNFTIVTGATGTAMSGRAFWAGIVLEDE